MPTERRPHSMDIESRGSANHNAFLFLAWRFLDLHSKSRCSGPPQKPDCRRRAFSMRSPPTRASLHFLTSHFDLNFYPRLSSYPHHRSARARCRVCLGRSPPLFASRAHPLDPLLDTKNWARTSPPLEKKARALLRGFGVSDFPLSLCVIHWHSARAPVPSLHTRAPSRSK